MKLFVRALVPWQSGFDPRLKHLSAKATGDELPLLGEIHEALCRHSPGALLLAIVGGQVDGFALMTSWCFCGAISGMPGEENPYGGQQLQCLDPASWMVGMAPSTKWEYHATEVHPRRSDPDWYVAKQLATMVQKAKQYWPKKKLEDLGRPLRIRSMRPFFGWCFGFYVTWIPLVP